MNDPSQAWTWKCPFCGMLGWSNLERWHLESCIFNPARRHCCTCKFWHNICDKVEQGMKLDCSDWESGTDPLVEAIQFAKANELLKRKP